MKKSLRRLWALSLFALLGVVAGKAENNLPYSLDLSQEPIGWTVVDNSTLPNMTWKYKSNCIYDPSIYSYVPAVYIGTDWDASHNDYYVSPTFHLQPGVTYKVTTTTVSRNNPTLSLELTKSASNMDSNTKIADVTMGNGDYTSSKLDDEHDVTVTEEGDYHFALHVTSADAGSYWVYILGFNVASEGGSVTPPADEPVALPYAIDFTKSATGWEAVDHNNDGTTWDFYDNTGVGISTYSGSADDYLFSPGVDLTAGTTYSLHTSYAYLFGGDECALSLMVGRGKQVENLTQLADLSVSTGGLSSKDVTFVPDTSGRYYFAYHNTSVQSIGGMVYLQDFSIAEKSQEVEVFASDFSGEEPLSGWTIVDSNSDGVTWGITTGVEGITYNSDDTQAASPANDWLISPVVSLQEGKDYLLTYEFAQQGAFDPDSVEVALGDAPEAAKMTTLLGTELIDQSINKLSGTLRYSCPANQNAYFGFHVITANAENGQLSLKSVKVVAAEKATPKAIDSLEATSSSVDKTVSLSWKNPSKDTQDIDIAASLTLSVYADDVLIATLDNQKAGSAANYVYAPDNFSGKVTYKVIAAIGANKSEAKTVTINLDDVTGALELLKAFDVNYNNSSSWVIEDNDGNGAWMFDYGSVFRFNRKPDTKSQDDWLISPAVDLESSKHYVLKYQLKTARDYGTTLDVTIGQGQNSAAQTQVVASYNNLQQNGFGDFETSQFTVPTDGSYNIAFHVTSADYSVSFQNLRVYYVQEVTDGLQPVVANGVCAYNRASATLVLPENAASVVVYDLGGGLVLNQKADAATTVSLSSLASGVYVVTVKDAQGRNYRMKIVK